MKSNHIVYNYEKSRGRIDDILNSSDNWYEELWNDIPGRDKLTYSNGYYVNCTAVFIDIRWSSKLPDSHTRPVLAKLYRAYISEMVALMNWRTNCKEVNIHWDSVWGIFETSTKDDINQAFELAAMMSSLAKTLNIKLKKKGYSTFDVWIWMDYWRVLMIKAGYSGSTINDVVWMGEVVNVAAKLCAAWNKSLSDNELMLSTDIYSNLKKEYQWFCSWNAIRECYHTNVFNIAMNEWVSANQ